MKTISILGCGWLGFPLAKEFIKSGYEVRGSTTSPQKLSSLMENKISPILLILSPDVKGDNLDLFFTSDYLIINIPPPRIGNSEEFHLAQINSVISELKKYHCRKIIFISSTSVYGNTNAEVNEEDPPNPESDSGKVLVRVEEFLKTEKGFEVTIIRFGGLIGIDRNPVYYFSGKKKIPGGNAPLNLIHQEDCIGIIKCVIEKEIWNETINGVSPNHPIKKEFYTKAAVNMIQNIPEFEDEFKSYKIVSSIKVQELLNYNFIYPDPMMMI